MVLQIHTIKSAQGSRHKRKIVGRGNASGHGNYSGRGGKGQTARSGGSRGLKLKGFKFLLLSTPKLRGFHSLNIKPEEVNLSDLKKNYHEGEAVNLQSLKAKNLVGNTARSAKILLKGELTKKLIIQGIACTARAAEKIKEAGGEIK